MPRRKAQWQGERVRSETSSSPEPPKSVWRASPRQAGKTAAAQGRVLARRVGDQKARRMVGELQGGPGSSVVQRQHLPPGKQPRGLDPTSNPAQGAAERMQLLIRQGPFGQKQSQGPGEDPFIARWLAVLRKLDRFEESLKLNATQSIGMDMTASGGRGAKESTAARPAKDMIWISKETLELDSVLEMVNIVVLSVSKPGEIFTTPQKAGENPAEFTFEMKQKLDDLQKAFKELEADKKKDEAKGQVPRDDSARISALLDKVQKLKKDLELEIEKLEPGATKQVEFASKVQTPVTGAGLGKTGSGKVTSPPNKTGSVKGTGVPKPPYVTEEFKVPRSPSDSESEGVDVLFYMKAKGGSGLFRFLLVGEHTIEISVNEAMYVLFTPSIVRPADKVLNHYPRGYTYVYKGPEKFLSLLPGH